MQMKNMKIRPFYGSRAAIVPIPEDASALRNATREQLAVLLALSAEPDAACDVIAEKSGTTAAQLDAAVAYWQNAGILRAESAAARADAAAAAPHPDRAAELPHYNTEEAARFLETNPSASDLIDGCQRALGKIFNTSETEIVIGLLDYLSLEPDYILLLFAHCATHDQRSLRYIEKMAISLHDRGIVTYEQLDVHLKKLDQAKDAEYALRDMFGFGQRALTKKEKSAFLNWTAEWNLPLDLIRHAYEITVSKTGKPSVPYTNAILEKWRADNLVTLSAVETAEDAQRAQAQPGTSFNTDDFFEAALKRSYGESYTDDIFEAERNRAQERTHNKS